MKILALLHKKINNKFKASYKTGESDVDKIVRLRLGVIKIVYAVLIPLSITYLGLTVAGFTTGLAIWLSELSNFLLLAAPIAIILGVLYPFINFMDDAIYNYQTQLQEGLQKKLKINEIDFGKDVKDNIKETSFKEYLKRVGLWGATASRQQEADNFIKTNVHSYLTKTILIMPLFISAMLIEKVSRPLSMGILVIALMKFMYDSISILFKGVAQGKTYELEKDNAFLAMRDELFNNPEKLKLFLIEAYPFMKGWSVHNAMTIKRIMIFAFTKNEYGFKQLMWPVVQQYIRAIDKAEKERSEIEQKLGGSVEEGQLRGGEQNEKIVNNLSSTMAVDSENINNGVKAVRATTKYLYHK